MSSDKRSSVRIEGRMAQQTGSSRFDSRTSRNTPFFFTKPGRSDGSRVCLSFSPARLVATLYESGVCCESTNRGSYNKKFWFYPSSGSAKNAVEVLIAIIFIWFVCFTHSSPSLKTSHVRIYEALEELLSVVIKIRPIPHKPPLPLPELRRFPLAD